MADPHAEASSIMSTASVIRMGSLSMMSVNVWSQFSPIASGAAEVALRSAHRSRVARLSTFLLASVSSDRAWQLLEERS
jgi:hypothetical protein